MSMLPFNWLLPLLLLLPHTHHESFANSYFRNFNLIDQFAIHNLLFSPFTAHCLCLSDYKISPVQHHKLLLSHFRAIILLFGFLINDLITVERDLTSSFCAVFFTSLFLPSLLDRSHIMLRFEQLSERLNEWHIIQGFRKDYWIKSVKKLFWTKKKLLVSQKLFWQINWTIALWFVRFSMMMIISVTFISFDKRESEKEWIYKSHECIYFHTGFKHRGFIIPKKYTNLKFIYLNREMSITIPNRRRTAQIDFNLGSLTKSGMQIK